MCLILLDTLDVEKGFSRATLVSIRTKRKETGIITRRKRLQQDPFQKADSDRAYHLSIEKVENSERYIQKQMRKYDKISDIVYGLVN